MKNTYRKIHDYSDINIHQNKYIFKNKFEETHFV